MRVLSVRPVVRLPPLLLGSCYIYPADLNSLPGILLPGTLGLNLAPKSGKTVEATSNFSSHWESRDPASPGLQSLKQEDDPYVGFSIDAGESNTLLFPAVRSATVAL